MACVANVATMAAAPVSVYIMNVPVCILVLLTSAHVQGVQ